MRAVAILGRDPVRDPSATESRTTAAGSSRLSRLYRLECLRGAAALYVCASHFCQLTFGLHQVWTLPFKFGQEAVALFFLISGFVIFYSYERSPDKTFKSYVSRRVRRIYPIFLLSLLLCILLLHDRNEYLNPAGLLGNLLMLQDDYDIKPGVLVGTYADNIPLWSLSYEWWFYLLFFPLRTKIPDWAQKYVVCAGSVAAIVIYNLYPNQPSLFLAYFMIWWTGAELARSHLAGKRIRLTLLLPLCGTVAAFAIPAFRGLANDAELQSAFHSAGNALTGFAHAFPLIQQAFSHHPVVELQHSGFALVAILAGLAWSRFGWWGFNMTLGPFSKIAPISYGIYVLHYPILSAQFLRDLPRGLEMIAYLSIALLFASFAEGPFQRWANGLFAGRRTAPGERPLIPVSP
jgi:peptidoglycan/LPS O-acetylase OafA/YrhL